MGKKENLSPMNVTVDRGNLGRGVMKSWDKSHLNVDHLMLGCVFQDMKPPKSILRKSSDMQKPIQRVKFTKAVARHTKIREQNPSLGCVCPGKPHQRSPNAPKFEDRSQDETEWARARCPRSSVEAGLKCINFKGARKSNILLTFGKQVPACIKS